MPALIADRVNAFEEMLRIGGSMPCALSPSFR